MENLDDALESGAMTLAKAVSEETGTPLTQILKDLRQNTKRVSELRKSSGGKFKVIGVDKFDNTDFVFGEYDDAETALTVARLETMAAQQSASDCSIATVYYAYNPDGKYLGGDVWKGA